MELGRFRPGDYGVLETVFEVLVQKKWSKIFVEGEIRRHGCRRGGLVDEM